jgi:NitT/TauT family transport system permease protein
MRSALPIATVVLALIAVWYVGAALMNASLQRDQFANAGRMDYSAQDLLGASLNMERPKLPAPHQVASELYKLVLDTPPTSKPSRRPLSVSRSARRSASGSPCSSSRCAGSSGR